MNKVQVAFFKKLSDITTRTIWEILGIAYYHFRYRTQVSVLEFHVNGIDQNTLRSSNSPSIQAHAT